MSKALCSYAFDTLYTLLHGTSPTSLAKHFAVLQESLSDYPSSAPVFVTWNQSGRLRGCIGTFASEPIEKGVARYAVVAARQDTRFRPISKLDLNSELLVSVTLLDNFTHIDEWDDWTIGLNGLRISLDLEGSHYLGTFLPSVAEEEDWSKEDTLYYLLIKAELSGISQDRVVGFYKKGIKEGWLHLTRYDGLKLQLDFSQFLEVRKALQP
ncbi:uncharacterized protein CANTADRAFT_46969 [Suhomyces tanzawaensis NRRL Y-17324]|uniref:AMMECR1 domain-containing protein n=1 Tax=Suhomyces tanzawaensis NRRL Y-17324 TaxID=984487 RepID=A0A1E4SLP6_9ASCO|nr:uncharacterized protein CANTADRAFT_46969 [Suhomyces tanzawaensis NRRL Y-17324]ODV80446.1 hypothetical protein CANTADRAFT_46969 [Suhomyces tanzawaensis NRRL Y-17324]